MTIVFVDNVTTASLLSGAKCSWSLAGTCTVAVIL